MKRKVIGIFAVLAIVALSAYNVNFNKEKEQLSALALANIEALAQGEVIVGIPCRNTTYGWCIYYYPDYYEAPGEPYI